MLEPPAGGAYEISSAVAVIDSQLAAYVAGDVAAFAACYAEDAVCMEIPGGRIIAAGRTAIAAVWGAVFARSPRSCVIRNRIVLGSFVVDHEQVTVLASGVVIEAVAIYRVVDGLIAQVWFPVGTACG